MPATFAGPSVSVVLDLLCLLPAILVLLRRAVDDSFRLPPVAGIGFAWCCCRYGRSPAWAGPATRLRQALAASTWLAAAALLFAIAGSVRSWGDTRVCAGLLVGILAANVLTGLWFLTSELPATIEQFESNIEANLRARGMTPGSTSADLFMGRMKRGEYFGNTSSVNSFAATLGSLSLVSIGLVWSSLREKCPPWSMFAVVFGLAGVGCAVAAAGGIADSYLLLNLGTVIAAGGAIFALSRDPTRLAVPNLVVVAGAMYLFLRTGGRTALLAMVIAGGAMALLWLVRSRLRSWMGAAVVAAVLAGAGVLLLWGIATGDMPHVSLRFRLYYWLGALGMTGESPLLGVGFGNFGDAYLLHRPLAAAEEVKDPHSLPMRFLAETGLIGLGLAIAWLLTLGRDVAKASGAAVIGNVASAKLAAWVAVLAGVLATAATLDFAADPGFVALEVMQAIVVTLAMAACVIFAVARSTEATDIEVSPAPAVVASLLAAAGALLIHTMLDVVLFSESVLFIAVLVVGPVLGTRQVVVGPRRRSLFLVTTGVAAISAVVYAGLFALPVVLAESSAQQGDLLVRQNRPQEAVRAYEAAFERSPMINGDYLARKGDALLFADDAIAAEEAYEAAAATAPANIKYLSALATFAERRGDRAAVVILREQMIELNPSEVALRLRLADAYEAAGRPADAAEQLSTALNLDAAFAADEPERLGDEVVDSIKSRMAALRAEAD